MMLQNLIIALVFVAAAAYLLRLLYRSLFAPQQDGCAKGCGACSTIDFKKIQRELDAKNLKTR